MNPYDKNLCMEERATPVIGPLVSSERITAKNGLRYVRVSSSEISIGSMVMERGSDMRNFSLASQQTCNFVECGAQIFESLQ